ncbi:MAG: transketolase [Anaerolineales bacterium]|nr:transketolase [Anaerolineales bacterium]
MSDQADLQTRAINTIRFLSADGVQKANSGHPGLPMGAAEIAYTVYTKHLRHNPKNPNFFNRDRFVLSGGHGSMLIYSLLHLTGYDLSLEELKNFRQWGSRTPGHPEYGLTPGVETTTGPLGQGFANGVGMAIAAEHLAARFNRPGHRLIDHYIYAIVTDGDLMEGVSSEAASLAGHLKLGRLIYLYDDNQISIDGSTDLAFTENRNKRFEAYGWHVQTVLNGNDVEALDDAIRAAKVDQRPSLISVKTQIGYGLPTRAGTAKAHGEPPGVEELEGAKKALGWPLEPDFYIPEDVAEFYRKALEAGSTLEAEWQAALAEYAAAYPDLGAELKRILTGDLPANWQEGLPTFEADAKGQATRAASGKVLNALADVLPDLIGGSADLAPSNKTWIDGGESFQDGAYGNRNFHFGVREHGMAAILNGMSTYHGVIPYGGTFLVFSDYMRGALRIAALSHLHTIWVFTHDSIGLGEDGPTHQPVEHAAALRAMPNMTVIRPADANEVVEAWRAAILNHSGPTALLLSRQGTPTLNREIFSPADGLHKGGYILVDLGEGDPEVILMATGTEVQLIVEAGQKLAAEGANVRLVSFPSWELFAKQDQAYQDSVLPPDVTARISIEAGVSMGWERWVGPAGKMIGVDRFGASAPYKTIYQKLGITAEAVVEAAKDLLG